ncbi:DUF6612 family protein [Alkalihalobacillus sp. BA299]|uniref:DUF6612 family protein n=1 Tax=Alkalihalobacillus sp. BA299 TaxID=2815938 RepID=UPI001ADBF0C4|nr:DUF6612 family protein [Alkalihalobacillus sp. BA299]
MRFQKFVISAQLIGLFGFLVACESEGEQVTPEEVLHKSIQAMGEVQTYAFELDSISSEAEMGTVTAHINGAATVQPMVAHINRTSKVATRTMQSEAYIQEDETYFLMDREKGLWINVSPDVRGISPAKEMELILENIDLFKFVEDKNGYRFSITTSEAEKDVLWKGLFPFYYVMDDPLFYTLMHVIRSESGPLYLNYEMTIDKESFYRTSAMMEYAFDMNIQDDNSDGKVTETLYMKYHSMNETEEISVPRSVIENAKTYGDILFEDFERTDHRSEEKKGNTDGNHLNGSYFATDGKAVFYSNWMQESGIYKLTDDHLEKERISDVFAVDLNVVNDWLYYSDEKDGFNVYRMRKDGTEVEKVSNDYAIDLKVVDDWVFYKTNHPLKNTQPLFLVKANDGVKIQLIDDLFRYSIYDDQVVYQKEPQGVLYLLEIDEIRQTSPTIIDYPASSFIVEDGWLYFESAVENEGIYRVSLDGTQVERLTDVESQGFNVIGDELYYTNVSDGHSLYKLNLNTRQTEKLDDRGGHIHIINDRIYYSKHISGLELGWFQMNIDGSDAIRAPF